MAAAAYEQLIAQITQNPDSFNLIIDTKYKNNVHHALSLALHLNKPKFCVLLIEKGAYAKFSVLHTLLNKLEPQDFIDHMPLSALIIKIIKEPDNDTSDLHGVNDLHKALEYAVILGKPKFCAQLIEKGACCFTTLFDDALTLFNKCFGEGLFACISILAQYSDCLSIDTNNAALLKIILTAIDSRDLGCGNVCCNDFYKHCKNIACIKVILRSKFCKKFCAVLAYDKHTDKYMLQLFATYNKNVQITTFCVWMGLPATSDILQNVAFQKCVLALQRLY